MTVQSRTHENSHPCVIFDINSMIYQVCAQLERLDEMNLTIYLNEIDKRICQVLEKYNSRHYIMFTDNNKPTFRHDIQKTYKANRVGRPKPRFYAEVAKHLKEKWNCYIAHDKLEADDECMIHSIAYKNNYDIVVASIDHDLLQHPGKYYNFKKGEEHIVDDAQAYKNLWTQVLTGDHGDNVKGLLGIGTVRAESILGAGGSHDLSYKAWSAYCSQLGLRRGTVTMMESLQLILLLKSKDEVNAISSSYVLQSVCQLDQVPKEKTAKEF